VTLKTRRAGVGEGEALKPARRPTPQQRRRAADDRAYRRLNAAFRLAHPVCEVCGRATEAVHHRRGRGPWYLRVESWAALCSGCHERCHGDPVWGRGRGLMLSRHATEDVVTAR
jgi:hypothetical protein